jgi:hypothetical protein
MVFNFNIDGKILKTEISIKNKIIDKVLFKYIKTIVRSALKIL